MDSNSSSLSIKDFQIVKELGSGSFGKVKLVKKQENGILYALKTVSLTRLSQKQKNSALNQIRLLASIRIPTVITYEGSFFNNETQQLCVLMQYADGGDLQNKIIDRQNEQKGGFEQHFIWKVAYQILQGLKSLHKNNIIHRDIKSANIFFVKGVAKLGDMNVSKIAQNGLCSTQTGTPYYTSPQVWSGQKYGCKCDVWSMGCILYELCALKVPFKATDFPSLYRRITKGQYVPLPEKYSQKMINLIRMCLTTEQQMRPSAAQLLEGSLFASLNLQFSDIDQGEINIVDPIKCPKVLRFLNSRLPKPRAEDSSKKIVNFLSKKDLNESSSSNSKQNTLYRKIRSQKMIKWSEQDNLMAPRHHVLKMPHQKESQQEPTSSQKKINGLFFSNKKLKIKPISSKLILEKIQSSKLIY